jgi:hypothetical protein
MLATREKSRTGEEDEEGLNPGPGPRREDRGSMQTNSMKDFGFTCTRRFVEGGGSWLQRSSLVGRAGRLPKDGMGGLRPMHRVSGSKFAKYLSRLT